MAVTGKMFPLKSAAGPVSPSSSPPASSLSDRSSGTPSMEKKQANKQASKKGGAENREHPVSSHGFPSFISGPQGQCYSRRSTRPGVGNVGLTLGHSPDCSGSVSTFIK